MNWGVGVCVGGEMEDVGVNGDTGREKRERPGLGQKLREGSRECLTGSPGDSDGQCCQTPGFYSP